MASIVTAIDISTFDTLFTGIFLYLRFLPYIYQTVHRILCCKKILSILYLNIISHNTHPPNWVFYCCHLWPVFFPQPSTINLQSSTTILYPTLNLYPWPSYCSYCIISKRYGHKVNENKQVTITKTNCSYLLKQWPQKGFLKGFFFVVFVSFSTQAVGQSQSRTRLYVWCRFKYSCVKITNNLITLVKYIPYLRRY